MGWLFYNRRKGVSDFDHFTKDSGAFTWSDPSCADYRLVASATVDRKVFYGVLEMNAERRPELMPDENGKVRLCVVLLIKWVPNDYHNFGYKDMDEFMGPCEVSCPEKILDQLSPIRPEALSAAIDKRDADLAAGKKSWEVGSGLISAADWREACRRVIAVRKATRTVGQRFTLAHPMKFNDGVATSELTVGRIYRQRPIFVRPDGVSVAVRRTDYDRLQLA